MLCVARPLSDCTLEVGVESHDTLYRNPFLDPLDPHELKADIATPKEASRPKLPSNIATTTPPSTSPTSCAR